MTPVHHFVFDVESLSTESTCVIPSAAIVKFDIDPQNLPKKPNLEAYYNTLLNSALFVKFDIMEQKKVYGRITEKETLDWWAKRGKEIRDFSVVPSKNDVTAEHGLLLLRNYIIANGGAKNIVWVRGTLDVLAIDSLAKAVGVEPICKWWCYRDIRTAIDILAKSNLNGYCDTRYPFDKDIVIKHNPVHDVAYDAIMLTFMETE